LFVVLSCSKPKSQNPVTEVDFNSLSSLDKGKYIYNKNCGNCHTLYTVTSYSGAQWDTILPKMVFNANISSTNQLLLYKYLTNGRPSPSKYFYEPTNSDVTTTATLTDLQKGKILYLNNCSKCHQYYTPDSFSVSKWKDIEPTMAQYAKLTTEEGVFVLKYVTKGN
jgi:mono/diheme cytochrome c family protein